MKRFFLFGLSGTFACILIALNSIAQSDGVLIGNQNGDMIASANNIVQMLGLTPVKEAGNSVAAINVNSRVQKSFAKSFGHVDQVAWSQLGNKNYLAQFMIDGRKTNALFANSGFLEYAISFGGEQNLPKEIRRIVRTNFVDYNIGTASEVRLQNKTAWVVTLAGESNHVVARVIDGYIDELSNLQMQPAVKKRKGKVIVQNNEAH